MKKNKGSGKETGNEDEEEEQDGSSNDDDDGLYIYLDVFFSIKNISYAFCFFLNYNNCEILPLFFSS